MQRISSPVSLPAGLDLDRLMTDALDPEETVHLMGRRLEPTMARRHLPLDA